MYVIDICVRCNNVSIDGRFLTMDDINDAWEYITEHTELCHYEPVVCIDCKSEVGAIAAEQLLIEFNTQNS